VRNEYPFTSIVGQQQMKLALVLNAINPRIGGVLVRGERGTAKSTAVRSLAALLPEQKVVVGCHYSCDPDAARDLCPDCRARLKAGEELPTALTRMRVVELPVGASEDRVVGSIDLEAAIRHGERRFEPGSCWPRPTATSSTSTRSTSSTTTSSTFSSTPPRWGSTPWSVKASPSPTRLVSSWSAP